MSTQPVEMTPPQAGEIVLFCAHTDLSNYAPAYWWYLGEHNVVRDDDVEIDARWAVICEACNLETKRKGIIEPVLEYEQEWAGPSPDIRRIQ